MALLEILTFPDPRLRQVAKPVDKVTPELVELAKNMLETMYDKRGIGLAAVQVGELVRLLVMDTRPRDAEDRYDQSELTEIEQSFDAPIIIFNPEIIEKQGETSYQEGCLSVPSYFENVDRAEFIVVKGLSIDGEPIELELDGLISICMQHEIDHLDGKLFLDRLSLIKSSRLKNKIKKFGYPDPSAAKEKEEATNSELVD